MLKIILFTSSFIIFFPVLAFKAPTPGTVITNENVDHYSEVIDTPFLELIKEGAVTITVGNTFSIPLNPRFLEQTLKFKGVSKIDQTTGHILNYQQGLPFYEQPVLDDNQAGLKIAWNMRYTYGGDSSLVDPFIWEYRDMKSGKIERTLSFVGKTLRYKHRVMLEPLPDLPNNPTDIFSGIYLLAKQPYDIRNTQLLVHRLEDDAARERTWLYLSVHRRVRRLPSGQSTDAFLGSDIMIEDFLGYNGRIMDMSWKYLGEQQLLSPFFRYDQIQLEEGEKDSDGFSFGTFHGQGNCFPNVTWQLRKVYKLEAIPKWKQHPLSKRIFYVDAETFVPLSGRYYDRAGKIWRIAVGGFAHPDYHLSQNKNSGVPIPSLISMIDLQAKHCTTLKMKTQINIEHLKQKDFTVQSLRVKGR
ncbi:MAG: outer membrane lipoprotein-sorting protein [Gammaproteobacteria bacterium]|nr:MAG: outer membrane lipoprotein-sorting protein [Gammaproteobacteria bacterium]